MQTTPVNTVLEAPSLKWGVLALYSLIIIIGAAHHEPWSDEAQSWLIARDNNLPGILGLLPSEGHPPLWYLILYPVTHAGLPYEVIKWITVAICTASAYLLIFKTRIHIVLKLLLPFSYLFLFEYAHFGRSYCLIIFFVTAILSMYENRYNKPWLYAICIVGLFNTHILVFPLAFGLTMLYIIDAAQYKQLNARTVITFAAMCVGGLYLLIYLTSNDMVSYFAEHITDHGKRISDAIKGALLIEGSAPLALLLLTACLLMLIKKPKVFALAVFALVGVLYILGYRYVGTLRHYAIIFTILITCYGIAAYYKENPPTFLKSIQAPIEQYGMWLMCAVIALQLPHTNKNYMQDIHGLYSDAGNAAEYIEDNTPEDAIIVGHQSITTLGLLPYLPDRQLYYAECQRYGTFNIYDSCYRAARWRLPVDFAIDVAHENFKGKLDKVIFLFNSPVMPRSLTYLDQLYSTSEPTAKWDESYYVYKFKENVK